MRSMSRGGNYRGGKCVFENTIGQKMKNKSKNNEKYSGSWNIQAKGQGTICISLALNAKISYQRADESAECWSVKVLGA